MSSSEMREYRVGEMLYIYSEKSGGPEIFPALILSKSVSENLDGSTSVDFKAKIFEGKSVTQLSVDVFTKKVDGMVFSSMEEIHRKMEEIAKKKIADRIEFLRKDTYVKVKNLSEKENLGVPEVVYKKILGPLLDDEDDREASEEKDRFQDAKKSESSNPKRKEKEEEEEEEKPQLDAQNFGDDKAEEKESQDSSKKKEPTRKRRGRPPKKSNASESKSSAARKTESVEQTFDATVAASDILDTRKEATNSNHNTSNKNSKLDELASKFQNEIGAVSTRSPKQTSDTEDEDNLTDEEEKALAKKGLEEFYDQTMHGGNMEELIENYYSNVNVNTDNPYHRQYVDDTRNAIVRGEYEYYEYDDDRHVARPISKRDAVSDLHMTRQDILDPRKPKPVLFDVLPKKRFKKLTMDDLRND